jgi:hypothetical protein
MEPGTGGEKPRSGRVTRSVYDAIAWGRTCQHLRTQEHGNGTSSASVAMCEAFFDTCAAYSHEWLTPTRGTHESRRVRAQRSACGYHKKFVRIFFDTKFHDGTLASESPHEAITISQHHECCVTTHCNKSDDNKKKIYRWRCMKQVDAMMSMIDA